MDVSRGRLTELESEREGLKEEESQRAELRLVIGRIEEFADQMRAGLDTSDAKTRRRIICALVKEIPIHAEEVHIVYRVNPRPFAQTAPATGNMPVCWGHSATPAGSIDAHRPAMTRVTILVAAVISASLYGPRLL